MDRTTRYQSPTCCTAESDGSASPRAGIVGAATKLFSNKGYGQTTMSDIARAAGLQQSSLNYWFRNKEQLLQETLLFNRAPLEFIADVGAGSGSPAVKLYRLLRFDTMQLAMSRMDFNEIQRIARDQRADYHQFWTDYERLRQWVVDLIGATACSAARGSRRCVRHLRPLQSTAP